MRSSHFQVVLGHGNSESKKWDAQSSSYFPLSLLLDCDSKETHAISLLTFLLSLPIAPRCRTQTVRRHHAISLLTFLLSLTIGSSCKTRMIPRRLTKSSTEDFFLYLVIESIRKLKKIYQKLHRGRLLIFLIGSANKEMEDFVLLVMKPIGK